MEWPARSLDLNPLDYYLWGKMKEQLYHNGGTFDGDMEQCTQNIFDIANNIDQAGIQRATDQEFRTRLNCCIQQNGEYFEQHRH